MNHHYSDIRDEIPSEPKWWDENAVPRYCEFGPRECANIYAREIVLLLIECQNCGREFRVCMSQSNMDRFKRYQPDDGEVALWPKFSESVADLHYGDPPNVACCGGGPTMNSIPRRVLEFWDHHDAEGEYLWEPRRRPELEREIVCEWAT